MIAGHYELEAWLSCIPGCLHTCFTNLLLVLEVLREWCCCMKGVSVVAGHAGGAVWWGMDSCVRSTRTMRHNVQLQETKGKESIDVDGLWLRVQRWRLKEKSQPTD